MEDHSPQQKHADVKGVFILELYVKHSAWKPEKKRWAEISNSANQAPGHSSFSIMPGGDLHTLVNTGPIENYLSTEN